MDPELIVYDCHEEPIGNITRKRVYYLRRDYEAKPTFSYQFIIEYL